MGINGKTILLGDLHFGIKKFSLKELKNMINFFNEQLFPYMNEHNIDTIFQLGDFFDNRTTVDIIFIHELEKLFFKELEKRNIKFYTLLGNHDIAYRESRDVNFVSIFERLYPNNFKVFKNKEIININGFKTYIVPWLVKNEKLEFDEIKDKDFILGHFEIRNFAMVKGHIDNKSVLTEGFFEKNTNIKNVFSGHYHLKSTDSSVVKYIGTPSWLNWGDHNEPKGFYVWDEFGAIEFIANKISKRFVKIKYNDEKELNGRYIEIKGLFEYTKFLTDEELESLTDILKNHEVKFFINKSKDSHHDEILYKMKKRNLSMTIIDNQEISNIIGTDYIEEVDNKTDSRTLALKVVEDHREDLLPLMVKLLEEVDNKTKGNE